MYYIYLFQKTADCPPSPFVKRIIILYLCVILKDKRQIKHLGTNTNCFNIFKGCSDLDEHGRNCKVQPKVNWNKMYLKED